MMIKLRGKALRSYRVAHGILIEEFAETHGVTVEEVEKLEQEREPDYINELEG